jgi:multiple sugar transport system permease protein
VNKYFLQKIFSKEATWGWVMVAPTLIGLIVLNFIPLIETIIMSFSKTRPFGQYELQGVKNYVEAFTSGELWQATGNTILFCIITVPIGIALSLGVAILLNKKIKLRGLYRALYFLPMIVSPAAIAMVWRWMFNSQYGIINTVTGAHVNWLTNPALVLSACAAVAIWSAIGYDTVLLLSGLQSIPKSYYEAANIDGASKIRQFFTITLPMLSPTMFFTIIMRIMASLKIYDLIYMMIEPTNPALPQAQSLMYLFYRESFIVGNKGYGSVIAIWTVVLVAIVTFIQFKGQKKWVNYDM